MNSARGVKSRLVRPAAGILALLVVVILVSFGAADRTSAQATGPDEATVYLPLCFDAASLVAMAPPATVDAPRDTPTPESTETVSIPPTITPLPSATPTATESSSPSRIFGRLLSGGEPLKAYGQPGGPQIELRVCRSMKDECVGDEWESIDSAVSDEEGVFEFRSPPELDEGEAYQVWWVNDFENVDQATMDFLGRWWSRPIESFGPGDEIDVGRFEVENLLLREICHDCSQSLPIKFRWDRRPNKAEEYAWSLFRGCGYVEPRYGAFRTDLLGHKGTYELQSPPRGFRLNDKYCWYVFIDDGANGTGWTFEEYRVTFLQQP